MHCDCDIFRYPIVYLNGALYNFFVAVIQPLSQEGDMTGDRRASGAGLPLVIGQYTSSFFWTLSLKSTEFILR